MERPNFLLIMTDQQRADHLGCAGHPILRTPHIDSIAARGVGFDRFYVATPICMPNRSTLMTGRMPSAHGVRHNGIPLSLRATTFVELMRQAGYRTALVGKSHLQNMLDRPALVPDPRDPALAKPPAALDEANAPHEGRYDQEYAARWRRDPGRTMELPYYGFETVDLAIQHADQVDGHYTAWLAERHPDPDSLRGPKNALPADIVAPQAWRTRIPEELYPTSYVAERTIARLDEFAKTPDRPFLLKCSFPDPHHPFTPPGRYWDLYRPADMVLPESWHFDRRHAPPHVAHLLDERDSGARNANSPALFACTEPEARQATALTFGMIAMIDDAVGRVLARLEALGLAENTVVIFTADHGEYMGDHQLLLKGPIHYQSLIRVPFFWADPAKADGGTPRDTLAGTIDIAQTILERAGMAGFNGMQGMSLLGAIDGAGGPAREALVIEEEGQRVYMGFPSRVRVRTLVTERHRLSLYGGVGWGEFYDLRDDPHELVNLWDDAGRAGELRALQDRLIREMIAVSDTSPRPSALA